jgi:hypothetical protein
MRIFTLLALLSLTGCMSKQSPLLNIVDMTQTDFSNVASFKKGESCQTLLFGALPIGGSSSAISAIEKGDIQFVKAIDYRLKSWIIVTQNCVTVYGE